MYFSLCKCTLQFYFVNILLKLFVLDLYRNNARLLNTSRSSSTIGACSTSHVSLYERLPRVNVSQNVQQPIKDLHAIGHPVETSARGPYSHLETRISKNSRHVNEDRRKLLLGGHAYSWGINTHYEMLLLENTRS